MTAYVFRDPGLLWLAALLPVALVFALRRAPPALRFAPGAHDLPSSLRVRVLFLPVALQLLGLVLVIVALARPAEKEPLPVESAGIDILLCIDTSSSMTATDLDPERTRLAVARDAATDFIRGRPDDRIGLITFARYPDLRCPLTRDHDALAQILAAVETVPGDGPEDATGFGAAVARAAQVLNSAPQRSRVVILLTDGEENVAIQGASREIAPAHAAQLCEQLGVRVSAIAVGLERTTPKGERVRLDVRPLQRIATRTGGTFHEARDAGALEAVYARIDAMEKAPVEEPRFIFADRFLAFLLLGLGLLIAGRFLGATALAVSP